MKDYAKYVFTLGDTPKRHYKGGRLRPKDAFKLGLKVSKELCTVLASSSGLESLANTENSSSQTENSKSQEDKPTNIGMAVNALSKIEPCVYLEFVDTVMSNTIIEASADGGKNRTLVSEMAINDWFEIYPEDYLLFTAHILWENVSPFLPKPFQEVIKTLEVDFKKTL